MLKPEASSWGEFFLFATIIIIAACLAFGEPIQAQQANVNPALVVDTCGAGPAPYPATGARAPMTVDVNGNLCAGVSVMASVATTGLATSITVGASSVGQVGTLVQAIAGTNAPTYVGGTINPLSVDLTGALRVNGTFSPAANATVDLNRISGQVLKAAGSGALAVVGAVSDAGTVLGGPVIVGGVSGTTVQQVEMNNQTPAGSEYGVIVRNIPSGTQTVSGTVTVTDGAGALNTIIDSGTVTTITNPVTVTDGAGSLNVIVDSFGATANVNFLTASIATTVGNTVNVNFLTSSIVVGDGSGALNVICDSGCSASSGVDLVNVRGTLIPNAGTGALAVAGVVSDGGTVLGAPVIIGGVSGSTVQQLELNNQTPAGTEYGLVTRNIPSGTQTVSGTVTAANTAFGALSVALQNTGGSGSVGTMTVTDGSGALNVICDSGCSATGNIVSINGTTVPAAGSGALAVGGIVSDGIAIVGQPLPIAGVDAQGKVQSIFVDGGGVQAVVLASTSGTGSIGTFTVTSGVATGASVSTVQPVYNGGNGSGALFPIITCDSTVVVNLASSGTTQLVALSAGKRIYVCSYSLFAAGTVSVQLEDGTTAGAGVGCTAGTGAVTGNYPFTAQTGISKGSGLGMVTKTNLSAALCARTNATTTVVGEIAYTQFGLNWLGILALSLWRRRQRCARF